MEEEALAMRRLEDGRSGFSFEEGPKWKKWLKQWRIHKMEVTNPTGRFLLPSSGNPKAKASSSILGLP